MRSSLLALAGLVTTVISYQPLQSVDNLVVFGDSYTDEGRLNWFINHNGSAPPPGTYIPASNDTASGGHTWPYFASRALGSRRYNYAISGASCSNKVTPRYLSYIDADYPSVKEYQVPAFRADVAYSDQTDKDPLYPDLRADNTLYALWIGTNDLGNGGFLIDNQVPGKTITDFVECLWAAFDGIYEAGGRHFVLFSEVPLDHSPLYAAPGNGGAANNEYWSNKTSYNMTEYEQKMLEYSTNVNTMSQYGAPFQLLVQKRWPGASFTIFNVHQLVLDMISDPGSYLAPPANATSCYVCQSDAEYPIENFLWYDELHPSWKTDETIAAEFVKLTRRNSTYGTYY